MDYLPEDTKLTFVTEDGVEIDLERLGEAVKEPYFNLPPNLSREEMRKYISNKNTCLWTYDKAKYEYNSGCGKSFDLNECSLRENNFYYCPMCGGKLLNA